MNKSKWIYLTIYLIIVVIAVFLRNLFLSKKESFEILPFLVADSIDSSIYAGATNHMRRDYFLVVGFENYEKNISQIDSFVCSKAPEIDLLLKKDSNYTIVFLKRSKITNNEYLKAHPRDYEEYSLFSDLICRYNWRNRWFYGRYEGTMEFKHTPIDCTVFE